MAASPRICATGGCVTGGSVEPNSLGPTYAALRRRLIKSIRRYIPRFDEDYGRALANLRPIAGSR
jgi:hypothetical protein